MFDLARLPRNLAIWSLVCTFCAWPSYMVASSQFRSHDERMGMALGVACFAVAFALVTSMKWFVSWSRAPAIGLTLRIGFGTRLVMSLLFPVALVVDMVLGMFSISIAEVIVRTREGLLFTFAATLIQGTLMNFLLLLFMSIVYPIVRMTARPRQRPWECCRACGYDLRASRSVCPECGTPIPTPP